MTIFTMRRVRWAAAASLSAVLAACAGTPSPQEPAQEPVGITGPVDANSENTSSGTEVSTLPATSPFTSSGNSVIDAWRDDFAARAAANGRADWAIRAVLEDITPMERFFPARSFKTASAADASSQAEFSKPIWEYLRTAVASTRRTKGAREINDNQAMFNGIENRYGVNAEVLAAIWGMETIFGGNIGSDDSAIALSNMAAEGRRRSFAEGELLALMKILENGVADRDQFISSWAGAMGQTQFMPSTFINYAKDWEGDGKINLWDSEGDALASAANYLSESGYKLNQPWGIEVSTPSNFDYSLANGSDRSMTTWQSVGVAPISGGSFQTNGANEAELWLPAGATGPKYLLFDNFDAFKKYNNSNSYAMAVGLLSDAIAGRSGDPVTPWPTDLERLSKGDLMTLQSSLNQLGYDAGPVDGIMGSRTRGALQQFQKARGFLADGYPTQIMLAYVQGALNPQTSSYVPNNG